ncbi:MAG: aminomethyltransferase family protein [Deltaproteobacteria bacterium]|nr:aminomethyltransferase family protein [Deltaproteobacteria bacterium]
MAKQSLLTDFHRSNGAVFTERDSWLLPVHFGDVAAEYETVRRAVGLFDLSHRGLLQFTGPDRLTFLQGMLSNDLRPLKTFDGQYATLLSQQGKVLADLRVLCALNSLYLDFWENLKDRIIEHLNRYLVADEVEIADRSGEYATLSLQGTNAETLLRDVTGPADLPSQSAHHAMINLEGAAVCVVRAGHADEPGFDLIIPNAAVESIARRLTDSGKQFGIRWVGGEAQNLLRIEAGVPRYGIDFSEENLLLEVGLDHAVSFTKGCYLGQEVVERIRSRGHVNRKLCGLSLDGQTPAESGDVIQVDGKEIGRVTSSVVSPRLKRPIALGYLQKDFWNAGTTVTINRAGAQIRAVVTALPFATSS